MIANEHIKIGSNSYEKVKTIKYFGSLLANQNSIHEEIKCRLKAGNSYYYSVQTLLAAWLLSKNLKIKIYIIASCAIWMWNMVSYIKRGMQAKGIWKLDPEANIWAPGGMSMGSGKGSIMRNFIVCTVHLIQSGWLNLEDWDGQGM
jgi:hypothetical protein